MSVETRLLYLDDMSLRETHAVITEVRPTAEGHINLLLDQTVFYPQGGGQPSDRGRIVTETGTAEIERVQLENGVAVHQGRLTEGTLVPGSLARVSIDAAVRELHTRLHSAGELICAAVRRLGHRWPVISAMHFPDASKVTFAGILDAEEFSTFEAALATDLGSMIANDNAISVITTTKQEEVKKICGFQPDYIKAGTPVRIIVMPDGVGRPCMGTHVDRTSAIGSIVIRNIRIRRGEVSVGYRLAQ